MPKTEPVWESMLEGSKPHTRLQKKRNEGNERKGNLGAPGGIRTRVAGLPLHPCSERPAYLTGLYSAAVSTGAPIEAGAGSETNLRA